MTMFKKCRGFYREKRLGSSQAFFSLWIPLHFLNIVIIHLSAYEDGTECSETSAYKFQPPGNYPKENIQHYSILLFVCPSDFLFFVSEAIHFFFAALPWLSGSAAVLSSRSLEFNPSAVHVWFVVDSMALTQFLQVLRFAPLTTILPMLHIHWSIPKSV